MKNKTFYKMIGVDDHGERTTYASGYDPEPLIERAKKANNWLDEMSYDEYYRYFVVYRDENGEERKA